MFTKESLYINAVKYDTQLKLDYKKLNNEEVFAFTFYRCYLIVLCANSETRHDKIRCKITPK